MDSPHGSTPTIIHSPNSQAFVNAKMRELARELPYSEEYGGLDFTGSHTIVAVNIEVRFGELFLACERPPGNGPYSGKFNNVAGHMLGDGSASILDTAFGELGEEIGLYPPFSGTVIIGDVLSKRLDTGKTLHIVAMHVALDEPHEVVLNDEHVSSRWVTWDEYAQLNVLPLVHGIRRYFSGIDTTTIDSGYRPIRLSNPGIAPMIG